MEAHTFNVRRMQLLRVYISSAVFAKRALFSWLRPSMWAAQLFVISFFQIAFFVYLAGYIETQGGRSQIEYVAIGNALQSISYVSVFSVCNLTSEEKWQGTLTQLLSTPANRFALFVGRASFQVLNGMLTVLIAFFYVGLVFRVDLSHTNILGLAFVIALTSFSMTGFGLMLASLGLYLRTAMIIANIFLFLTMLVSGVNFPVAYLPEWMKPLSYAIPLTYGTDAARIAVAGADIATLLLVLIQEATAGVAAIVAGYVLFRFFESRARRKGTMEEF